MDQRSRMATIRLGDALGDTTPAIKYELENNLNSSTVILDVNGTLVNSQEYFPFGETSFGSFGKKRYQYTGKERDEETALYYYGARYYHTTLCRFVSVDPLAPKFADLSPYNYAGNKPITKVDIDGLQEENRAQTQQSEGNKAEAKDEGSSESTSTSASSNSSSGEKSQSVNSALPKRENIHGAPEKIEFRGEYGADYKEITDDTARAAFSPSNPDKGKIPTYNPKTEKNIYWNKNFKTDAGVGAYFWQKEIVRDKPQLQPLSRNNLSNIPTFTAANRSIIAPPINEKSIAKQPVAKNTLSINVPIIIPISHMTDGSITLNDAGNIPELDGIVSQIRNSSSRITQITINAQIGIGLNAKKEYEYSENLFNNASTYLSQKLPNIQINRGSIGPASGPQRVSDRSPLSIMLR